MRRFLGAAIFLTIGCGDNKDDATATGGVEGSGGGGGETTAVGGAATTGTTEPQTSGATGGEGDLEGRCMAACELQDMCMLELSDIGMCVHWCLEDLGGDAACVEAGKAFLQCLVGMTCEQLLALYEDDDPGPCARTIAEVDEVCEPSGCTTTYLLDEQGTDCVKEIECGGEASLAMKCDQGGCVCLTDGMQGGESCPSEGACESFATMDVKASECCGF